jgi:hypothetical protein
MKRVFSVLMIVALVCAMFAGCNNQPAPTTPSTPATTPSTTPTTVPTEPAIQLPASALELLETVWNTWEFEYKDYFMGGGYTNMVSGMPGAIESTDTDALMYLLFVTEGHVADVQEAASAFHAMNYSVFTSGSFKVADATAFATSLKEGFDNTQWICGSPASLLIYTLGNEYVLYAMGETENLEGFRTAVATAYGDAVTFYDGAME